MAIFGRKTARQRLREATRQSLVIPTFNTGADCTAAILHGLWPAELAVLTAATAPLAEYLDADLRRIAHSANEKLQLLERAALSGPDRQAAEARVLNVARAFAVLRVESTVRQLHCAAHDLGAGFRDVPAVDARLPAAAPVPIEPPADSSTQAGAESDAQRLQRLLAFVARQVPDVSWAVGTRDGGSPTLLTDLAHGWIPPGVVLPAGVRLPGPARRNGGVAALLGTTTHSAAYLPGQRLGGATESAPARSSIAPRALPAVDDLGRALSAATHRREGLPGLAHTLAVAAAAGAATADAELDLLRVHLDTARYRLLAQYPEPDAALLLDCMLLAAVDGIVTGDTLSANYHFSWFQVLSRSPEDDRG